ncbi:MAG: hypothetical protein AAB443_04175 [Patescibacteria group bacterium]
MWGNAELDKKRKFWDTSLGLGLIGTFQLLFAAFANQPGGALMGALLLIGSFVVFWIMKG